jgi:nitrate/TMAO reductase-like tetraheme cytochrome c subunit
MKWLFLMALVACGENKENPAPDTMSEEPQDTQTQDSAQAPPPNYTSAKVCGECHTRQFKEWQQSMHAYAATSPVFEAMNSKAFRDSSGEVGTFCTGCHAPVGTALGEGGHTAVAERSELSKEGVTCSYCHSAVAHDGPIGNNNLANDPEGPLQGPFETDGSEGHVSESSDFIQSPEFCGSCHDVFSFPALRIEEAFTEYKESPAAAEGVRCQDCHMGPNPGKPDERPMGPSAEGDPGDYPDREQASHFFVGPDYALVPNWPFGEDTEANQNALAQSLIRTEKLLQNAIKIAFVKLRTTENTLQIEVNLNVLVQGHGFPTGFTSERQAWLQVQVTNADGDSLFKSGDLDPYGDLRDAHSRAVKEGSVEKDEALINFQSKNLLRFGEINELHVNETVFPFDADWIEKKNLSPGENRSFIYRINQPTGPYSVDVSLNYRNLPPYLLRALQLDELVPQLKIFTIDSKRVDSP